MPPCGNNITALLIQAVVILRKIVVMRFDGRLSLNLISRICLFVTISYSVVSCADTSDAAKAKNEKEAVVNPFVYVEIPVIDMDRAMGFYSAVFGFGFERDTIDHNDMALFPFDSTGPGISGALAKGSIYKPSLEGTLIYFRTTNIQETIARVTSNGGMVLYPVTSIGAKGFVAEFKDTEGNRIGLHQ